MYARSDSTASVAIGVYASLRLSVDSNACLQMDVVLLRAIETRWKHLHLAAAHSEAFVALCVGLLVEIDTGRLVRRELDEQILLFRA